jgi:polyisoprenoid-binding protein YceI
MTFKSKKATSAGPNKMKVVGDLTIHGVTKEATLDVEFTPMIKDPWGNEKFGATATTTIDRTAYGLGWNKALETGGVMVGTDVSITIDAELAKKKEAPAEKK